MSTAYSTSQFGPFRQLFITATPDENFTYTGDDYGHGETVADDLRQIDSVLDGCRRILQENNFWNCTAMCSFFLADIGKKEIVRQRIAEKFPEGLGAVTFINQGPADGAVIAAEIWAIDQRQSDGSLLWMFVGGVRPADECVGAYHRAFGAFKNLDEQLQQKGHSLGQILRTWIYQGLLLLPEKSESHGTQRYKELNRARTDYFEGVKFFENLLPKNFQGAAYPASTGIGTDDADIVLASVSLSDTAGRLKIIPLENPNQVPAFDYGTVHSPQSPKFSRALAAVLEQSCLIFVSGTASITDSASVHIEDPAGQTEQTLDNIEALISTDNLRQHGIDGFTSGLHNLECVRVYVKRKAELDVIRSVCARRLKNIPVLYAIADVCRPELLVEIEGYAVVKSN